jgi:hypothetical protein
VLDVSLDVNLIGHQDQGRRHAADQHHRQREDARRHHDAGNWFKLSLNGSVAFLEVLVRRGFTIIVGADHAGHSGVGKWSVAFNASMSFFGLATMAASGWFDSNGYFDISLDGGLTLGTSDFGLVASFHFRVGFGERLKTDANNNTLQVDPDNDGVFTNTTETEYYFLVEASGSAKLRAFGITLAGISIGFSVTAKGEGRVPVVVSAQATIEFLFFDITVRMKFTLGYIELPKKIYLAGEQATPTLWSPPANGVLYLNMGETRNASRGIGQGAEDELYIIEHVSGTAGRDDRVKFSGREQVFTG